MASEEADCCSQMSYAFLEAGRVAVRGFPYSHHSSRSLGNTDKKNPTSLEHQRTVPVKTSCNIANKGIWEAFPWCAFSVCPGQLVAALEQSFMSVTGGNQAPAVLHKSKSREGPSTRNRSRQTGTGSAGSRAGGEQSWGYGRPRLNGSYPLERPEFLHPPSAGKATEGSFNFFLQ